MVLYCIGIVGVAKYISSEKIPAKRKYSGSALKRTIGFQSAFDIHPDINFEQLALDIANSPMFSMRTIDPDVTDANRRDRLAVFFDPDHQCSWQICAISKYRIVHRFFEMPTLKADTSLIDETLSDIQNDESTAGDSKISDDSIRNLYEMLRSAHSKRKVKKRLTQNSSPDGLVPKLRKYQVDAVNWMLSRELDLNYIPLSEFKAIPLRNKDIPHHTYYINHRTLELKKELPGELALPTGGILGDEMGLGKTVEILALIMCNRRGITNPRKQKEPYLHKKGRLLCMCFSKSTMNLVRCRECLCCQHIGCVRTSADEDLNDYICPACWGKTKKLIDSNATFIVTPYTIKMQWQKEVEKHTADGKLKVLIYNGVKSRWISPVELSTYDIIITDYAVLRSEFHFSANTQHPQNRRNKPTYLNPVSPLMFVKWWRVCLDEAQMAESSLANSTKMVRQLSAVHRWAITGTPIEKSIDNLYGLLVFLGITPYDDFDAWKQLSMQFQQANAQPLVDVLQLIMWRTCKSVVTSQLGIPPQTAVLHMVDMCDLQAFFYKTRHNEYAEAFRTNAAKLGSSSMSMFKMNPSTLKKLMEPLRKLRRDCVVPSDIKSTVGKRLMSQEELHNHMVAKHETECKSHLRTLASSINGFAAICAAKGEYELASNHYKHLLRWANDYTGIVSVDSLLQVHALHNLLDMMTLSGSDDADKEKHRQDLVRMETKYMSNCSDLIFKTRTKQQTAEAVIDKLNQKLFDSKCGWWSDFLFEHMIRAHERNLIDRINIDLTKTLPGSDRHNLRSISEISFILTKWLDEIKNERHIIQQEFENLQFFAQNLKARGILDSDLMDRIERFVQTALDCHLDQSRYKTRDAQTSKKDQCELCKVKSSLIRYECVIFDKTLDKSGNDTKGSWNPTYQENVFKIILSLLKNTYPHLLELIKDGDTHLAIIDAIKSEYKDYSSYWVEINYAAAAYDELNMCKSRLTFRESDSDKTQSQLLINKAEMANILWGFNCDYNAAETKFHRIQGTLKYLKHLGKQSGPPEACPICTQVPQKKYSVLECGHLMCILCMVQLQKNERQSNTMDCPICRNKQARANLYFVNCKQLQTVAPSVPRIEVRGNYSQKIISIVENVLKLRIQEPDVKVILFSQWMDILYVIEQSLIENGIKFLFRKNGEKKIDIFGEFKDPTLKVTCLLLPLATGSKGLNLTEATHVFLIEPILNPAEELQAIGRVHRIGQTRPTFVHRFIMRNTIEQKIYETISNDSSGRWKSKAATVENLEELFNYETTQM